MADFYLRSTDGSDSDNGTTWALAKATLAGAFAVMSAGDRVFVADAHAETQATAMTLTSPGTAADPCLVICVDDTGDPEPPTTLATTATISTTGASAISFQGFAYVYGVAFQSGVSAGTNASLNFNSSSPWTWILDGCVLAVKTTSTSSRITLGLSTTGADDNQLELRNTRLEFSSTSQGINKLTARMIWEYTVSALVGTVPTTLFLLGNAAGGSTFVRGVDLQAAGSGVNLVDQSALGPHRVVLNGCRYGTAVAIVTGTHPGPGGPVVESYNSDSADTHVRNERFVYQGTMLTVTDVVRTNGASDGSTAYAWRLASSAGADLVSPLVSFPISGFFATTGSKTVTLSYIHGGASALTNAAFWIELEYLGTSGIPRSSKASSAPATVLTAASNNSADTSQAWDTGATARANSTAYSLNDIRRAATANGKLFIVTTAGTSAGSEPGGFTTAADGDSVTDNTVTWRCMRREKVSVTVTVNEVGAFRTWGALGAASGAVWMCPLVVES